MKTLDKARSILHTISPTPNYLTLDPVGLDISNDAVRLMHFTNEKDTRIPDIYKEVPLKEFCPLLENETDLDGCDELRSILQNLKTEFHLRYVHVSLPEAKTYVFKTEVPRVALATLEEALAFKIEENVPLSPDDVVFDYKVIPNHISNEKVNVVVWALPKSIIEVYSQLLNDVGLVPVSFEPESHALAKSVVPKEDTSPYLVLNMKKSDVTMSIVEHNAVHYTSTLPVPSTDIIKDLNGSAANAFKEQINKLLIFWFTNQNQSNPQEKIQTVILSGAYAMTPGFTTFLERRLKVNVRIANVWSNCFSLNEYVPMISYKKSLDYGTSIGLMLN